MDTQPGFQLPPLSAVRVFEAAARHLSFTRAAEELGMTQAAVSYQIRLLEDRVGTPLFRRLTRRVALTEAGARLAPVLTEAMSRMAGAFAALREDAGGLISVTTVLTMASNWLVPRLGRFQAAHPGYTVRVDTATRLVDFTRGEHDLGIRVGKGLWPGLAAHWLMPVDFAPMCSPALLERAGGLSHPRDLLRLPLLWDDADAWQRWFAAAGQAVPASVADEGLRLDTQQMMGQVAKAGQGVALLNPLLFAEELASGQLVQPFPTLLREDSAYYVVYLETRRDVPKIALFRDWLLAEAAETMAAREASAA
ncbi:transcriptional regulator GcvA [Inquilinus limosus]|uniref:transcriptional regulator GcvA n=1 Tax=Inquilinus limosus TaxID=171674 RepID=UPI00041E63C7|nr:transcriptional regulator GcvA [Inquilinus limosus]